MYMWHGQKSINESTHAWVKVFASRVACICEGFCVEVDRALTCASAKDSSPGISLSVSTKLAALDGGMDGWMDGWMGGGRMDEVWGVDGSMGRWVDGWMGGWMDEV